ncbi:MAG: flavin reductase family protein [Cyclobacteriaceae bacterium]|nr:flavin reductase family protein [Cyclobacteriaceae bacterium]
MLINPKELSTPKLQAYLQGAVSPRPIALASTIDKDGNVNLSPFSFFNLFSMNPPILIFSPSRRVRDNSTKHTLQNVQEVPEVVINIVSYTMVEQVSLASCDFPKGTNEFEKAGFTEVTSIHVNPPRVAESPVSFECKVNQVIPLGQEGGAGNLVICEVVLMHIDDEVLGVDGFIDPNKIDAVARMGQDYYCRASGENVFTVPKPNTKVGIGIDQIPTHIRNSNVLTGNDLGRLGNIEKLPTESEIKLFQSTKLWKDAKGNGVKELHQLAKNYLSENKLEEAWKVLL